MQTVSLLEGFIIISSISDESSSISFKSFIKIAITETGGLPFFNSSLSVNNGMHLHPFSSIVTGLKLRGSFISSL